MEFGLLGPLLVHHDGLMVNVSAAKQRVILGCLLLLTVAHRNRHSQSISLAALGRVLSAAGRAAEAADAFTEAAQLHRQFGNRQQAATLFTDAGNAHHRAGQSAPAESCWREASALADPPDPTY
jgi:tetratricopeptide (TPR) repeat protein